MVGGLLIATGALLGLFIAFELLAVYRHPDSHPFIVYLSGKLSGAELIVAKDTVRLGEGGATIAAFVLLGFFAWIAAGIAFTFISAGQGLASAQIRKLINSIRAARQPGSDDPQG